VNGTRYEATVPVRLTLADFLRHQLGSPARISAASTACAAPARFCSTDIRRAPA
jgi:hypothetical protein